MTADGLAVAGHSTLSFMYSPDNVVGGGSGTVLVTPPPRPVVCGRTDLQPAYLALVNEQGVLEMLARFKALKGVLCQ